jgi:hypothetical protein
MNSAPANRRQVGCEYYELYFSLYLSARRSTVRSEGAFMDTNQDRCMGALAPVLLEAHDCWHRAMATYQTYPPLALAQHNDRAAASSVHSHMWMELQAAFADTSGVTLLDVRGLQLMNVGDKVVCRFKKVDRGGNSVTHPSQQQEDFDRQLSIPGLPPAATRLTLGYQPDAAFSAIERILVSCQMGKTILWCAQVNSVEAAAVWEDITPRRFEGTGRVISYKERKAGSRDG